MATSENYLGIIAGIDRKRRIQEAVNKHPDYANMSHFAIMAIDKQLDELDAKKKGAKKCK